MLCGWAAGCVREQHIRPASARLGVDSLGRRYCTPTPIALASPAPHALVGTSASEQRRIVSARGDPARLHSLREIDSS
jgi:hypothetical protein